jgi:hypothetical protein
MNTKILLVLGLGCCACLPASVRGQSAAELLDRAIWWPGDYRQVCRDDSPVGWFGLVPLHDYGTFVPQEYFLSKDTISALSAQRQAVVEELGLRLKTFHWKNIPPAPPVSAEVQKLADGVRDVRGPQGENIPIPGPRKFDNPRALGATMLRVIEALQTTELLPELLRLEEELDEINEKADGTSIRIFGEKAKEPEVPIPAIVAGDDLVWTGYGDDSSDLDQPDRDAVLKRKQQIFSNRVFQREILGVCLGMLAKKGYAPLRDSLTGRLHALSEKRHPPGLLPGTDDVRADARRLVQDFMAGKESPAPKVDGATLLDESIATPGSWNQMCGMPPEIPRNVPIPAGARLAPRHFNLGGATLQRLLAYREFVMPVLVARIQDLKIATPSPEDKSAVGESSWRNRRSGQKGTEFGPLIFQVVEELNAVECLPGLLRLEQELHDLVAATEKDASLPVPLLRIDSPSAWVPPDASKTKAEAERETAIRTCRIYHREMLGLMREILMQEDYSPMRNSALEKTLREAGRAAFRKEHAAEVAKFTSFEQIPEYLRGYVIWDEAKRKAEISADASYRAAVPYSETVRDEVLRLTRQFLKEVPPEKSRAADGMILPWYSYLPRK